MLLVIVQQVGCVLVLLTLILCLDWRLHLILAVALKLSCFLDAGFPDLALLVAVVDRRFAFGAVQKVRALARLEPRFSFLNR